MAIASSFLIGANDEHGMNPPTAGKRTPVLPYINRPFYENEFNRQAKYAFILACLRCGFNVYDVHPEIEDLSISTRVRRTNSSGVNLVVTFAYNAYGDGRTFAGPNGIEVYYSPLNRFVAQSRQLSQDVYENVLRTTGNNGRFVGQLSIGMLTNVNCPATLIEAGFMTNFEEAKLMLNPDYVLNVGEGACRGVCEFLDVEYVPRELVNYPTIKQGSSGNSVKALQYLLNQYGYNLEPDGRFGGNTYRAVVDFQKNNGLTQDGIVGPNTWSALLNLNATSKVLRFGNKSSAVLYLQRYLLSYLYPITDLDSVFGRETENAVKEFQQENGLVVDGIVGPNTWTKIISTSGRNLP